VFKNKNIGINNKIRFKTDLKSVNLYIAPKYRFLKKNVFKIILSFMFICSQHINAQEPVQKYYKVDKDYIVIDSTILDFKAFPIDSVKVYEKEYKKNLKKLESIKDNYRTTEAYHYIINANKYLNRPDSALVYLYKALELPNVKTSKGAINIYWEIFRIYSYAENYSAQLELIEPLTQLGAKYNYFKDTKPLNLKKINADVLSAAGYYEEACSYYTKYLVNSPLNFDPLRFAVTTNDLACIYETLNVPDSVSKYRNISLKTLNFNTRKSTFDKTYTEHIKNFIKLHDIWYNKIFTKKNLAFSKEFLANARKNYYGETHIAIYVNHFISDYYFYLKDYEKALYYINQTLKIGDKKLSLKKSKDIYFLKFRILDKLGKEDLASTTLNQLEKIRSKKLLENRNLDLIRFEVNTFKEEKEKAERLTKESESNNRNTLILLIFISVITAITTIAYSVTKQKNRKIKAAENEIQRKLKDKVFLLKELNHRVKNNLSLILSIVQFQLYEITDPVYKEKFKSLELRISTIAVAHEQFLYDENNLEGEDFDLKLYLTKIIDALIKTSTRKIDLNLSVLDVKLNIDTVLPIGIIFNELVSNSIKHAKSKKDLIIDIDISSEQKGIKLHYKDSGTEFKLEKNKFNLGVNIIESMVMQLAGTIKREDSAYFIKLKLKRSKH
jgi:two-component sensor histidine kinase